MNSASIHTPLNSLHSEIRLLEILSVENSSITCCSLTRVSLREKPAFAALSYVWGDPGIVEDINVDGHIVSVTKNLAAALRYVRTSWVKHFPDRDQHSFRLWADAVCINQADMAERSSQVQQMGSIYKEAEVVLAWLGEGTNSDGSCLDFRLAFKFFEKMSIPAFEGFFHEEPLKLEWMKSHQELWIDDGSDRIPNNSIWHAAMDLLLLPYWQRAWIFQEAALAMKLLLCTVDLHVDFEKLELGSSLLTKIKNEIRSGRLERPEFLSPSIWTNLGDLSHCFTIISEVGSVRIRQLLAEPMFTYRGFGIRPQWQWTLYGSRLRATDPKDHIYALLGVTGINLTPCYEDHVSVRRVYRDYVAAWLEEFYNSISPDDEFFFLRGVLHFLFFAGTGRFNNPLRLPTWAPNFPEYSQDQITTTTPFRNCSDVDKLFPSPAAPAAIVNNYTLRCEGVTIDVITHLSDPVLREESIIPFFNGFASRHTRYASGVHPLNALLRALTLHGEEAVDDRFMAQAFSLLSVVLWIGMDIPGFGDSHLGLILTPTEKIVDKVLRDVFPEYQGHKSKWEKLFSLEFVAFHGLDEAAKASLLLRKLQGYRLYGTKGGYLGLTHEKTFRDDVICLLKGYWAPVVLRRAGDRYFFVNPSFVAGLMNDEVEEVIRANSGRIQSFFIR